MSDPKNKQKSSTKKDQHLTGEEVEERVGDLAPWTPAEEPPRREPIGERPTMPRHPESSVPTDTPRAIPEGEQDKLKYDITRRGDKEFPGDDVPTTGGPKERKIEETHL